MPAAVPPSVSSTLPISIQLAVISEHLGLALMIGGLLALGAFTAPVLFKQFDREAAGQAMTLIFRRYDGVLIAGMALVALGELIRGLVSGFGGSATAWLRLGFSITLVAAIGASVFGTNAALSRLYQSGQQQSPAFFKAHQTSEKLAKTQLLLSVLVLVLSVLS